MPCRRFAPYPLHYSGLASPEEEEKGHGALNIAWITRERNEQLLAGRGDKQGGSAKKEKCRCFERVRAKLFFVAVAETTKPPPALFSPSPPSLSLSSLSFLSLSLLLGGGKEERKEGGGQKGLFEITQGEREKGDVEGKAAANFQQGAKKREEKRRRRKG